MQINLTSDKEYARIARAQKEQVRELADRIERGDSLTGLDAKVAAGLLRAWADNLSEQQPRKKGHQPEVPTGSVSLCVEADRAGGMSRREAIKRAVETFGVSETSIKEALRKDGAEARAMLEGATIIRRGT